MKKTIQTIAEYVRKHSKTDFIALAVALAVFLTIALINAPRASIWFDEAFSAYITHFSFFDIVKYTATDVHPPFYYWLLKVWVAVFGTTDLGYRSLSVVLGGGTITVAFFLVRKLFGRRIAWVSLFLLSFSPMLVRYSDEARMYTLSAFIIFLATYVLVKIKEAPSKKLWIFYGVLVSLGMWTHYFTALAWLAHWVWWCIEKYHKGISRKQYFKAVFSKEWLLSYGLAVGLYLPWLPLMFRQLGIVQGYGFWIGPVGVDTPTNYLTNFFYYLEHSQVKSWLALALIIVVITTIIALPKAYKALTAKEKSGFRLVASLAWVPVVLLFVSSLPPLRSSFVERYLIPSLVALSLFLAIVLVVGTRKWKPILRAVPFVLIAAMMIFGVTNVYKYGNYNKNSNAHIMARQAVQLAQKTEGNIPIVANSPWIFYEVVPYATKSSPIYFIDEATSYGYGSLDMLKYSDDHKIKDLAAFEKEHPYIWYIGNTAEEDVSAYKDSWVKIKTVTVQDPLAKKALYRATLYKVSGE